MIKTHTHTHWYDERNLLRREGMHDDNNYQSTNPNLVLLQTHDEDPETSAIRLSICLASFST